MLLNLIINNITIIHIYYNILINLQIYFKFYFYNTIYCYNQVWGEFIIIKRIWYTNLIWFNTSSAAIASKFKIFIKYK